MLYAYWGMHPIAPPPGFDLDAFSAEPLVADAADAQQLAGGGVFNWAADLC